MKNALNLLIMAIYGICCNLSIVLSIYMLLDIIKNDYTNGRMLFLITGSVGWAWISKYFYSSYKKIMGGI